MRPATKLIQAVSYGALERLFVSWAAALLDSNIVV